MKTKYVNRIKQVYPALSIEHIEPNYMGQNNDVLIVNQSLIFRFPKYREGIISLKEETLLLESIRNLSAIAIPDPTYQSFEQMEVGQVFMGYKRIEGMPLWKEDFTKIKDKKLVRKLASQLVHFLVQLHSVPKEQIPGILCEQTKHTYKEVWELGKKIETKLYPFMSKDARKKTSELFESFLSNKSCFECKLIHGDFGTSNILWLPGQGISGVIDFGGSGLGDPAYDLAGLLASYGETFFKMCLDMYPDGIGLSERARFYQSTFALQEALHGIEQQDRQAFENGIKEYRE